jgi:hypothetical protein
MKVVEKVPLPCSSPAMVCLGAMRMGGVFGDSYPPRFTFGGEG